MDAFDEGGEGTRYGVGDEEDEGSAGKNGHETEAEEKVVQSLKIRVGLTVGFQDDDVRGGLQAGGKLDATGVIALIAERQFGRNELIAIAAGEFGFFQDWKGTDGNFAGFAENDVAGSDAGEVGGRAFADDAADDNEAEKIFALRVVKEGLKDDLVKTVAGEPPAGSFSACDGVRNQILGGARGEGRSGGMQGDDFGVTVNKDEEVAIVGAPGVFAGVADRGGISVAHVSERGEEIGFAAERSFLLAMDGLDSESGVLRIKFDLALDLGLGVATDDEESEAGEGGGEKDEGEEKLRAKAQAAGALTQEVCGRAAGEEPGAEPDIRHRASRVRKVADSINGTEVPILRYGE